MPPAEDAAPPAGPPAPVAPSETAPPRGDSPRPPGPEPGPVSGGADQRLDPASVTVDRIAGAVFSAVVTLIAFVAALLLITVGPLDRGDAPWLGVAWLLLGGLVTGLNLWWPALRWRHTSYRVTAEGMRIHRGVAWRTVSSVPRSRVQHTDVAQGPLERWYGLATLIVYTAGTQHASISLGGLAHGRALAIRDFLIVGGEDDAV
jgi:membrane protein YdbS with pleckstrin-like domain